MSERVCQVGKRTECVKARHEAGGSGVRDGGRGEEMRDVVVAVKGEVDDGVSRALSEVDIVSSMAERESRRKSRRPRSLKQKLSVMAVGGGGYGCDIIRDACGRGFGGDPGFFSVASEGGEVGVEVEGDVQNHASLNGLWRVWIDGEVEFRGPRRSEVALAFVIRH